MSPESYSGRTGGKHQGAGTAQQLDDEPDSDIDDGRYGDKKRDDDDWHQGKDIAFGEHQHIRCHDPGNGPGSPDSRNPGMPVENKMSETGKQSAKDIKHKISYFPHPVLDIITKDEQYPHIGNNMPPAAMQENIGKEGPYQRNSHFINGGQSTEPYLVRDQSVLINYGFSLLLIQKEYCIQEYTQVCQDE